MAKKPKPARRGRKAAIFDYKKIEKFSAMGLTKEDIGRALGYERSCFFEHKRNDEKIEDAIKRGRSKFKVIVSQNLVDQMKRGNVTAAIWLDKTRCGTREDGQGSDDEGSQVTPVRIIREVVDGRKIPIEQTSG